MRKIKGCWFRKLKKKNKKQQTKKKQQQQLPQFKKPHKDSIIAIWLHSSQAALLTHEINKHVGWALGWLILAFPIVKGLKVLNWSVWVKKRSINFQSLHHILPEQAASYQLGRGKSVHKGENLKNHQNYQCHSVMNFCNQYRYSCHFSSFFNFYPCSISQGNENFSVGSNHKKSHPECLSLAHSLVCSTFAVCMY